MTEPAAASKSVARRLRIQLQPWEQQPGENDLWYGRFLRYLCLGPTRSISLVSRGKRNQYPVPAHWPMVAKRDDWKVRAQAFDEAYKTNEADLKSWASTAIVTVRSRLSGDEADKMIGVAYQPPPPEEDYEDESQGSAR